MEIKKLIELINNKMSADSGRVYKDEPILRPASEIKPPVFSKYRKMRQIARELRCESDSRVFYEQGVFMKDFSDDREYDGSFVKYFPTYQSMNDRQLAGYFTWRARVRQGYIEKTSLSFAFVYVYELINQIGVLSEQQGFCMLCDFWREYRKLDSGLNAYMRIWLKDYVIYYGLDKSLFDGIDLPDAAGSEPSAETFESERRDAAALVLTQFENYSPGEVLNSLSLLSSYNIKNSKFYKAYPEDVEKVVYNVYSSLNELPGGVCGLIGRNVGSYYTMFKSAVFCERRKTRNSVYNWSETERYICRAGEWKTERFYCYRGKNKKLSELLKTVDYYMRRAYKFKFKLNQPPENPDFTKAVKNALQRLKEDKAKEKTDKIKIDTSGLEAIRSAARRTQIRLIVDDAQEQPTAAANPDFDYCARKAAGENSDGEPQNDTKQIKGEKDSGGENEFGLTLPELELIKRLQSGAPYEKMLKENGLMLSVAVDSVNEKLFELFGDSVICCDDTGKAPVIVEDYADELEEMINK